MNILFICKHNRFRSKVGEVFFNKYNRHSEYKAKSAGVALDPLYHYVAKNVILALKEKNAMVKSEKSQAINEHLLKWADKIIIVADNVDPCIFKGKDVEKWKIEDCSQEDLSEIRKRVGIIEKKVKDLVKKISK